MDTAHNKALVRRMLVDAFTAENPRAMTEQLIAPDWINIDPSLPNVGRGPEGALRLITLFRAAFPDLVIEDLDMIAEGDRVAGHFAFSGTHQGELMGIPPTGRKVYVTATGSSASRTGRWRRTASTSTAWVCCSRSARFRRKARPPRWSCGR